MYVVKIQCWMECQKSTCGEAKTMIFSLARLDLTYELKRLRQPINHTTEICADMV
jgi:hypothetical protein